MAPIEVVTALIRDGDGRILAVRKAGTGRFMLPGGKREPGEDDLQALSRELGEELGVRLAAATPLGRFEAEAANEPGRRVVGHVHLAEIAGAPRAAAEIADMRWIDPAPPYPVALAPLLETRILPALLALG